MTDARTQFLIQILDKIGGPLAAAVAAGPTLDSESAGAQRLAELLNRSVQLGLSVAADMNVRDEGQADGVHLSLAAFASPLMAGQYLLSGQVPGDAEIKRLTTSMQAVLTFADNFTPAADSTLRIQNSEPGAAPADEPLIYVQTLNAFAPVFQVVNDYAFGKPEAKVIQEIATRLWAKASEMRGDLFGSDMPVKLKHQTDLVLMRLLCGLYAACHNAEVRRLMSLSEQARTSTKVSMEPVWVAFDKQASMAMIVAGQLIPDTKGGTSSGPAAPAASVPAAPPSGASAGKPAAPPAISALAKKPAAEKPATPPADNALPAAIQLLAGKNAAKAPAAVSAASTPPAVKIPENKAAAGVNPMAFFAPGAQKDSDEEDVA
ncbi:MAG: hypothetical protein JWO78_1440 [Micavibrio sp.]|nr:hypothetical protein [Micavibrio sp.]